MPYVVLISGTGYSLGGDSLPEDELAPYIQQAKDQVSDCAQYVMHRYLISKQINFVVGDPATSAPGIFIYLLRMADKIHISLTHGTAALRASLGHPEPFTLRFVEVGNEVSYGTIVELPILTKV